MGILSNLSPGIKLERAYVNNGKNRGAGMTSSCIGGAGPRGLRDSAVQRKGDVRKDFPAAHENQARFASVPQPGNTLVAFTSGDRCVASNPGDRTEVTLSVPVRYLL